MACACDGVTDGASVAVFSVTGGTAGVPVALAAAAGVFADADVTASADVGCCSCFCYGCCYGGYDDGAASSGATWLLVDTATRKLLRERFLVFERLRAALFTRPKAIEPSSVLLFSAT